MGAQHGVPGGQSLMTGSEWVTGLMGQSDSVRTNKDSLLDQTLVSLPSLLLGPSLHMLIKSSFSKNPPLRSDQAPDPPFPSPR